MRVLAFDPGYERLGVAVLEKDKLLFSDCIRTSAKLHFAQRLTVVGKTAEALIKKWKPDAVALEEIYFAKNTKTALKVAEVRGVLTYLVTTNELPLFEYTPAEVKVAITGYGKSDKKAVGAMVLRLLGLQTLPAPARPAGGGRQGLDDELDAIAVGLTCLASIRHN